MILAGFIELIAKIKQKNNGTFKLVDAQDVECEDGKGLDEVLNEKLDKNQGTENVGLTLVVGKDGNLELGESTPKDVYTKEEVDYMLADKMDKPYVPITITDNATITDALEGNFKIDKIKGNTYQKVETDIVPTPSRPVPINSRKVLANGEYVELRSLKESKNLFDKNIMAFVLGTLNTDGIVNSSNYYITSGYILVKPNTKYVNNVSALGGFRMSNQVYFDNKKNAIQSDANTSFTTPANCYFIRYQVATTDTRLLTEEDILKVNNETMLVEGTSLPSTYIAPTIRDYKIVDHTNKTAKIVRNIKYVRVTPELVANKFNDYTESMKRAIIYTQDRFVIDNVTKAGYDLSNMAITRYGSLQNGNIFADVSGIANMYWYPDVSMIGLNGSETKDVASQKLVEFLTNNEMYVQYQLATPVEETITYVETDVSEVGYSWQDTTSPSPTIKSEVKGVEEIDILKTGKNLLNETLAKDYTNYINLGNGYSKFVVNVKPNTKYTVSRKDDKGAKLNNYMYVQGTQTMWMIHTNSNNVNVKQVTLTSTENGTLEVTFARINQTKLNEVWDILGYLQIELGETATAYEPYTGQHINIALPQPLYENDIANVESENYEYEMQKYVVTGDEVFIQDYQKKSGYYGRYFNLKNGMGLETDKVFCNCLNYVQSIWNSESEGVCQNSNIQIHLKFSNDRLGITDNTPVEEKRTAFANYLKQLYASKNPLYVVVKVAKTTQPIPEENLAKLKSLKTNAGVNNIFINGEVKPIVEARYPQDVVSAVNKLQTKLLTLQEEVVKNV